jgi:hypothetical protein
MENQTTAVTLREFLLQKFSNILTLSNMGFSDWTTSGRREGTEDMAFYIASPGLYDEKLAIAYREFFEPKGYKVNHWVGGMYLLEQEGDVIMALSHTYSDDRRSVRISVASI